MKLNLHVKYDSGKQKFDGLDHYEGAQSLLGMSQILLISLNAFFNKEILTQAPSAKGFRVVLGKNRVGSWDQALHIFITDPNVLTVMKDLGQSGLYDLLKWALVSGVGGFFAVKNRKAKKIIRDLERLNEDLHEKIEEALKRAHSPVKHQGLKVHVMAGQSVLAEFNEKTLRYIETEIIEDDTQQLLLGVSRFNARTGTGRFIADIDANSVPFYPEDKLSDNAKRLLADSLAYLTRENFVPLNVVISRVTSADGHLKSYRLHSAWAA